MQSSGEQKAYDTKAQSGCKQKREVLQALANAKRPFFRDLKVRIMRDAPGHLMWRSLGVKHWQFADCVVATENGRIVDVRGTPSHAKPSHAKQRGGGRTDKLKISTIAAGSIARNRRCLDRTKSVRHNRLLRRSFRCMTRNGMRELNRTVNRPMKCFNQKSIHFNSIKRG